MSVEAEYGLPKRMTKADLNSRHSGVSGIGLSQPVSKLDAVGNGGTSFLRVTQLADEYNFSRRHCVFIHRSRKTGFRTDVGRSKGIGCIV